MRAIRAILIVLTAATPFLAPTCLEGQKLPAESPFSRADVEIIARDRFVASGLLYGSSGTLDSHSARTPYTLPADSVQKDLGQRLVPYSLGGAAIGTVIGFALMPRSCDVSENMFCQYTLAAYPVFGAGAGGWAGILVGLLREL